MRNLLAGQIDVGTISGGSGPLANPGNNAGRLLGDVLSSAIGILTFVAAVWFLFNIITGGIAIIGAGPDKGKLEGARTKITNGIVGLIVTLSAMMILGMVVYILGLSSPLNPAGLILQIAL